MQNKILFFILFVLSLILSVTSAYKLGNDCSSKTILDRKGILLYNGYADHKSAFNGIGSCISLHSGDNTVCCYIKVKFKNKEADQRFTHRGCIEIKENEWAVIKETINQLERNITSPNITVEKQDVEIDCHSKLIKLTGLILLTFLL